MGAHHPARILVTGGAGFIGSALVRYLLRETDADVLNVDKLTYAGDPARLSEVADHPHHRFVQQDICDGAAVRRLIDDFQPQAVMHLAAESHVDRSIDAPAPFIQSNIVGTYQLLETCLGYWQELGSEERQRFRFLHVSTDEVYGNADEDQVFTEESPYRPSSPYAASKAAADHLVQAWWRTWGFPVIITLCSNNYGPHQHPEKFIPVIITRAMKGEAIPVYGDGTQERDWIYVDDHVAALHRVLVDGAVGERYNICTGRLVRNIDLAKMVCDILDRCMAPLPAGPRSHLIQFTSDRPGHDTRYDLDASRIREELGWEMETDLESGIANTVAWFRSVQASCDDHVSTV